MSIRVGLLLVLPTFSSEESLSDHQNRSFSDATVLAGRETAE